MLLRTSIFWLCSAVSALAADVAMVDDELGQAVLFENRGLCYAVLPNHVSATKSRIALAVAAPTETGVAEIFWRDPAQDLALAFVEGALQNRCDLTLQDLTPDLSAALQTVETGLIKSVHFGGSFFDRLGASVVDVDDRFITVRITQSGVDAEVLQGLSGALLTLSGRPAGIAIDAGSGAEARFLRMDKIASRLGASLSSDHPSTRALPQAETGHGFRVTGFSAGAGGGAVILEPGDLAQPWIAPWTGAPLAFEITVSNAMPVQINAVTMTSQGVDETRPRTISVEIDRGAPGAPFWSRLVTPDMAPNGVFEMTTGGTWGRRLRITIVDVWDASKPVRLDGIVVR